MTVPNLKVKVIRKPTIKVKTLVKFPANVVAQNFLTVTNNGGTYTFSVDYSKLGPGPVVDPTTAYVAVDDITAGAYKIVSLASLLTSGLDADLQAIAALTGTGILARTASNTWVLRTVTGTANEITVVNGDGVAGAPTISLPAAITFTGKTITGGTFSAPTITGGTHTAITSLGLRSTGAAFDLTFANTEVLTAGRTLTVKVNDAARTLNMGGDITTAGALTTSGAFASTFTMTGTTTVTFPVTGTLATLAGAEAFTNKTYNGNIWTAGSGTLTIAAGKTFSVANTLTINAVDGKSFNLNNTITFNAGADGTTQTFPATSATIARTDAGQTFVGTQTIATAIVNSGSISVTGADANFSAGGNRSFMDAGRMGTLNGGGAAFGLSIFSNNVQSITIGTAGALRFNAYANGITFTDASGNLTAGSLTGDVTTSGGIATTIAANAVTNAKMATMAAFTIKANATGSSAVPTDVSIPALTQKASPVAADKIMIADSAASDALKYATVSSLAAAGSVASIAGNTGAFTLANGITNNVNSIELTAARRTLPTTQTLTSGTGATYTTPANVLWLEIWIVGGGGGGGGASTTANTWVVGGNGTASTFNSVNANPGSGPIGTSTGNPQGGAGGTGGTGTATLRTPGQAGFTGYSTSTSTAPGGQGGNSQFRLGGAVGVGSTNTSAGVAGGTNTGGGGSGSSATGTNNNCAAGGGGGETAFLIINNPAATYTYTVGTGGAGGVSSTTGGAGGTGVIFVIEHYGS